MTIFQRLMAGYLVIMFMLLSFGGYVVFQLNRLAHLTHEAAGTDSEVIQIAESLSTSLQLLVNIEKKYWISADRDFYQLFLKRQQEFIEQLTSLEPLLADTASTVLFHEVQSLSHAYFNGVGAAERQGEGGSSTGYMAGRDKVTRTLLRSLGRIREAGDRVRDEKMVRSEAVSSRVLRVTIGFALACIAAGIGVSWLATKRIVRPIVVFQRKTREIASGNFVKIESMPAPLEICQLADEFNSMSEKLAELDRLKEDFISHVSHTLRTPLTAIWEASDMLINQTFENDSVSRSQLLTIVQDECRRLILSVNRILDLARMEGGMMEYRFVPADLNAVVEATIAALSPIARAKMIRLHFTPRPGLPPVRADTDQIRQLLENLIGNALQFTEAEGEVTVKIMAPATPGEKIQVAIVDTGCGIEQASLDSIFEKFQRIDRGRNTVRGTGLGLAIAKHIVAAHGGDIWVESEEGHGSTFYFSLRPA